MAIIEHKRKGKIIMSYGQEIASAIENFVKEAIEGNDRLADHTSDYDHDDFISRDELDELVTSDDVRNLIRDDPDLVSFHSVNELEKALAARIDAIEDKLPDYREVPGMDLILPDWISNVTKKIEEIEIRIGQKEEDIFIKFEHEKRVSLSNRVDRFEEKLEALEQVVNSPLHYATKKRQKKIDVFIESFQKALSTLELEGFGSPE